MGPLVSNRERGERNRGDCCFDWELNEGYCHQKKPLLVGCGQDISRNVMSGIDFETCPCSLLNLPRAVPEPSGNTYYTQKSCARVPHKDEGRGLVSSVGQRG